jgi:alpha-N-acetylglucosamine transferase
LSSAITPHIVTPPRSLHCPKLTEAGVWADSYTKLLAFNQTQYDRVLVLDSDATILQPMDELFFTPSNPATMPRAYWLSKPLLTSHIMLLEPSAHEFSRVQKAIWKAGRETYDMEIINDLYRGSCAVLPHQKYALLTGEFRRTEHKQYLAGSGEDWDPEKVRREAKYVHFSDHPLEKPWVESEDWKWEEAIPKCVEPAVGFEECRARDIWVELYDDFLERREVSLYFLAGN